MKTLFYIIMIPLGILVCGIGAALILITVGAKGVSKYETQVFIQKPAKDVYTKILDFESMPSWTGNLQKTLSKNPTINQVVGSRYVLVWGEGKNETTSELRITKLIPNKTISFQNDSTEYSIIQTYTLEPVEDTTKLKFVSNVQIKKSSPKLLFALNRYSIQKTTEKDLANLKMLVESE